MARKINKVFLHCSDSNLPQHDNIQTIAKWHKQRGFSKIGYHFVITKDGTVHKGRSVDVVPASQIGHNTGSISICLTGRDYFSAQQFYSLKKLCKKIHLQYNVTFHGHCEVSSKPCPVFDYTAVLNLKDGIFNAGNYNAVDGILQDGFQKRVKRWFEFLRKLFNNGDLFL